MDDEAWVRDKWARRWRLPLEIPESVALPAPAEGEVLVRHHCDTHVVARFDPARGEL